MLKKLNKKQKHEILDWLEDSIENSTIEDRMTTYVPMVQMSFAIDLSDGSIPFEIKERIKTKYYTRGE